MLPLQVGGAGPFLLFVVLPGLALASAIALSTYEVYRIGERKLLIVLVILALMFQHQVLEAVTFVQTGENVAEGFGEVFETGANLVASGSVYYVLRFARRERRLVEELERSEQQYRNLIEEAPVPVLLHGPQEIQYANDAAAEMLDADDPSSVTGPPLSSFLPPNESQRVRETVLTDGGTETVETRLRTLEDGTRHVVLAGAPANYEGDDATQVVAQDLTERRRRERELEIERDRRSMLFENNPDPVAEIEFETGRPRILEVNGSYEEVFGFDADSIGDRTIAEALVPASERDEYERLIERTLEGETVETEVNRNTEQGVREFLLRIIPFELGDETQRAYVWYTDITERRELERTYRTVFEGVSDGLVVHDPDSGEILDVNDRFCEMNGYVRDDLLGESVDVITGPDHTYEKAQEYIRQAREGERQLFEWRTQRRDGSTFPVEVHLSVVTIRGEERVLASVRDITERKRREREYEQIFHGVNDAITVFDPETAEILDVNQTYHEMLGYDDLERIRELGIEGLSVTEEGYTAEEGRKLIREVAETGESRTVEWRGETSDGEQLWLEATLTRAEIGGEERVLSLQRDVTERKRREREFEQIFHNVHGGITINDPETGELLRVNDSFCELLGYEREEVLEMGIEGISDSEHGFSMDRARNVVQGVVETGESRRIEWAVETSDGETRWLDVYGTTAEIGGERRYLSLARDVTERRRREREYEQIFHGVNDAIGIFDPETYELVDVNERMCELSGYERDRILEDDLVLSVADEGYDQDRIVEMIDEVTRTGESRELEWLIETAEGERRWLDVSATQATINGEQRVLTISRDVTERRRLERRLRAILDRIDEAIYFTRADEIATPRLHPDDLCAGHEDIWGRPLEEIYELYDTGVAGTVHSDDQAEFRTFVERIGQEVEAGTVADRYSREYRIERGDGATRWIRSDFYPTEWQTGPPRMVVVSRDITDRKAREQRIASFDEATDDLVTADTPEEATRTAVEAAAESLDLPAVGVFLYDSEEGVLRPDVLTGPLSEHVDADEFGPGSGPLWDAFASGTLVASDGGTAEDGFLEEGTEDATGLDALDEWRGLVLGNHGILVVGSPEGTVESDTVQETHVLAATLEAALNHLESQRQIAAREEQLQTQTRRAERLERVADLTQRVESAITEASDPVEIERAVCERLTSSGRYDLAWVGRVPVGADQITARTVVGAPDQYVDRLGLTTVDGGTDAHPAVRAWRTDSVQVADSIVRDGLAGDWRQRALTEGYQSLCAVPLTYDGVTHGVLTVGAGSPNAFGERERDVLEQLGTSIGYALAAIERRRALESDATVELEFAGNASDLRFARAAREADCEVRHERTVRRDDGTVSVYYDFTDARPEDIGDTVERILPGDVDVVSDDDSSTVVEARSDDWFGSPLAEYGAVLREATATPDETCLTVEVPAGADVRSFAGRLEEVAPTLDLVAKRQHQRQEHTAAEISSVIESELTDRQLEVVRTALSAGYFEWPREKDGNEVAEMLDITQPTLNKHLRTVERKTFGVLFDADA